jgi:dUTPase
VNMRMKQRYHVIDHYFANRIFVIVANCGTENLTIHPGTKSYCVNTYMLSVLLISDMNVILH